MRGGELFRHVGEEWRKLCVHHDILVKRGNLVDLLGPHLLDHFQPRTERCWNMVRDRQWDHLADA